MFFHLKIKEKEKKEILVYIPVKLLNISYLYIKMEEQKKKPLLFSLNYNKKLFKILIK